MRDPLGAFVDDEVAVKVLLVVNAVFDLMPVLSDFALLGTIAFNVHVEMHLDDFVGARKPSRMPCLSE